MYGGSVLLCRYTEGQTIYNTNQITPTIQTQEYSNLSMGSVFMFDLVHDDQKYDGFNVTLELSNASGVVATHYGLTGEGWIVDTIGPYNYTLSLPKYPEIANVTGSIYFYTNIFMTRNIVTGYDYKDVVSVKIFNVMDYPVANRVISVDINGTGSINCTSDENGLFYIPVKGLAPNSYNVHVYFQGDKYLSTFNSTISLLVNKAVTKFVPDLLITDYDSDEFLVVSFLNSFNRPVRGVNLTVDFNGVKNCTTDENGQIKIPTKGLTPNTYLVNVTFDGNEFYLESNATSKIVVNKLETKLTVNSVSTFYNVDDTLVISLTDSLGMNIGGALIYVDLNGTIRNYTTDKNGQVKISTRGYTHNTYPINITFNGNNIYEKSNATTKLVINKDIPILIANDVATYYNSSDELVIKLLDRDGNPISGVSISLALDYSKNSTNADGQFIFSTNASGVYTITLVDSRGNPVTGIPISTDLNNDVAYTTDNDGQIKLPIRNLVPDTYTANITFSGNEKYCQTNAVSKIIITKQLTYLDVKTVVYSYGDDENLIITLVNDQGNPIKDAVISVALDVFNVTFTTDENGQVNMPLINFNPGNFVVTGTYSGNDYYMESNASGVLVFNKCGTELSAVGVNTTYGVDKNIVVTLKDKNGNPIEDAEILVDIGAGNYTTDANGQVNISTNGLAPKTYNLKVTFNGDNKYDKSTGFVKVVVSKAASKLTAVGVNTTYGVDKNIVVTLKDENGNPIEGAEILVDIGAVIYTTDANGQVNISTNGLAPKTYNLKVTFNGDNNYDKSTGFVKVVVSKATPKLTAKSKTFKQSAKTKKYTVVLKTNKNKVMKSTWVTLKVNKKTYKVKTNTNGQATFNLNKLNKKGNYAAVVKYAGSKCYNGKSVNVKITVK